MSVRSLRPAFRPRGWNGHTCRRKRCSRARCFSGARCRFHAVRRELYLRIEVDPLDRGEPFLFSWGEQVRRRRARGDERGGGFDAGRTREGARRDRRGGRIARARATSRSMCSARAACGPSMRWPRAWIGSRSCRRNRRPLRGSRAVGAARRVLPVFLYRFDEVAAVVTGRSRPSPGRPRMRCSFVTRGSASRTIRTGWRRN